jgi:hypothetical protein
MMNILRMEGASTYGLSLYADDTELWLVDVDQNAVPSNGLLAMQPSALGVPLTRGRLF